MTQSTTTILTVGFLAVIAAGCSALPVAGPLASNVISNGDTSAPTHVNYLVVDVSAAVCDMVEREVAPRSGDALGSASTPPPYTVHVGDTLALTVWEPGASTLFSGMATTPITPAPRGTALPPLVVGADGRVTVPFAGRIAVAGKSPSEIERAIAVAFAGKVSDLQIVVNVTESQENVVTVGGEVGHGARVPLAVGGVRVLDAIAAAGGVRIAVNESAVRITRGARTVALTYGAILADQTKNIYLEAGDTITLVRSPTTFTSFGAFGRAYQIAFEADTISLVEAVAKAGGLQDQRADPSGIFVFRYEPSELARRLAAPAEQTSGDAMVPVVYHIDLSVAGGYFLARRFKVQDKDIVYAANARLNEVQKFLNLLGSVLTPAATGASVSSAVH